MKSILTALLVFSIFVSGCSNFGKSLNSEPEKVIFYTKDINNFWNAYDKSNPENLAENLQKNYFENGSKGLHDFYSIRIESSEKLAEKVNSSAKYYQSIRKNTLEIESKIPELKIDFQKMSDLYPNSVFPDVYFMIGRMNSGGTTSDHGLLIGAELFSISESSPKEELGTWEKSVVKSAEAIPLIVCHELIHYQQKDDGQLIHFVYKKTLLDRCLREGMADFIGELISGGNINKESVYKWAELHEKELWIEFKKEMMESDFKKWLYNGNLSDRPADVGYFMGYKICEAYYNKSSDKKRAIDEMLNNTNAEEILTKSGYAEKFKN